NIVSTHVTAVTADIQTANIDTANIKKLCEKKSDGAPVCVTGDQLAVLLAGSTVSPTCPTRKFHPAWIRLIGQNHCIVENDACDSAFARNVGRRPVQVAQGGVIFSLLNDSHARGYFAGTNYLLSTRQECR